MAMKSKLNQFEWLVSAAFYDKRESQAKPGRSLKTGPLAISRRHKNF